MGAGASSDISKDQLREKYEEVNYEEVQNSVVEAQWHKTVSCFCFFLVEQCIFPYFYSSLTEYLLSVYRSKTGSQKSSRLKSKRSSRIQTMS